MKTVKIGSQVWTKKNLKAFKFRNGEHIPIVQDTEEWKGMTSAAMCINPDNGECFYNWYAVVDPRGLAPEGFHVPSDQEWQQLTDECGGEEMAGQHLKSKKKWDGDNTSGFNALPAGVRSNYGLFYDMGLNGYWWSSPPNGESAISRAIYSGYSNVYRGNNYPQYGFSVRLVQD
jgi:uncharacterized protein (TIGR02145 family)